jgi:hypothetical protein
MNGRVAAIVGMALVLSGFLCPDDRKVTAVSLQPPFEHLYHESPDDAHVTLLRGVYALGDSAALLALAIANDDYKYPLYGAGERPGEFRFVTSDNEVATVSPTGMLTARRIGEARIGVTHLGFSDTLRVVVVPRVAELRVVVSPAALHVGETGTVLLSAVDSSGALLPRAYGRVYAGDPGLLDARDGRLTVVARGIGSAELHALFAGQELVRARTSISITP